MKPKKALLFDIVSCVGCGSCYEACKEVNDNGEPIDDFLKARLGPNTFTIVEEYGDYYSRKLCMHCIDPACASVCPVGALEKTDISSVIWHNDKCIGCRYCMQACPHTIPRYEWGSTDPRIRKCTMCYERISNGEQTGCAEACPFEATVFGDYDEIVELAKSRLKDDPESYYQKIYGLNDNSDLAMPVAGGTQVLIIAPEPFEQFGFVAGEPGYMGGLPEHPLPELTMKALSKVPHVVGLGSVFMGGMYWLTKRKNQIAKENKGGDNDN